LATYDENLWWATDMLSEASAPSAEWVFDNVTKYWYFQCSYRLGTQIAKMDNVIVNA